MKRALNFKKLWTKNFKENLNKESLESLGDRSLYVGSSDISGCLRKSYLQKLTRKEVSIEQSIILQRGHLAEDLVKKGFGNLPFKEQYEVKSKNGYYRSHIDFLIESEKEVIVVECKSLGTSVESPYDSWVLQVQFQMALLSQEKKGKKISACIVAVNVNNGWHEFFWIEPNAILQKLAMSKAEELKSALELQIEPKAEAQNYCGVCPFNSDCPLRLQGCSQISKALEGEAQEIVILNETTRVLNERLDTLKKAFVEKLNGLKIRKFSINDKIISLAGGTTSTQLDTNAWKQANPEGFENILKDYSKTVTRAKYLLIK